MSRVPSARPARNHQPRLVPLEDRVLLATCNVTRLTDAGAGKGLRGDLRYCVNKTNSDPGPDVIDFRVTGTINLDSPLPILAGDVLFDGPGAAALTIRRNAAAPFRIVEIYAGMNIQIKGVTIANGFIKDVVAPGGGIFNAGNLTLIGCVVTGNSVEATGTTAYGGGIFNEGDLTLVDTTVQGNSAFSKDFEEIYGGGIANYGALSVYSSAIVNNFAGSGLALVFGSAIFTGPSGAMTILNSTIAGNSSVGFINTGGAVLTDGFFNLISHSTIANNPSGGLGMALTQAAPMYMRNTIVAGNVGDVYGVLTASTFNLIGNTTYGGGFSPSDLLNVDPLLSALEFNGGLTPTIALLPGSPAINAGDNADAPEWDQRGVGYERIANDAIDIGAFEVQSTSQLGTNRPRIDPLSVQSRLVKRH